MIKMKCPECNSEELIKGPKKIEADGSEYFELRCTNCKHRFADIKIPYSAIIWDGLEQKEAESLVDLLIASGLNIDKKLAEDIKNDKDTIPFLINILKDEKVWEKGNGWAAINTMHILSAMKAKEAIPIIIDLLKKEPDSFGDWLTETVPSLLFNFGKDNTNILIGLLNDKKVDTYSRNAASRALTCLAYHNHELKPQIITTYKTILQDAINNKEDNELISFFVEEAASLQDEELFSLVKQAFEKGLVSKEITEIGFSEESFKTGLPHDLEKDTEDPMNHFDRKNINYLLKVNYPEQIKVSKNQPCPCGSGKKYKMCCMKNEK